MSTALHGQPHSAASWPHPMPLTGGSSLVQYIGRSFKASPRQLGFVTLACALVQAVCAPIGGLVGHYANRCETGMRAHCAALCCGWSDVADGSAVALLSCCRPQHRASAHCATAHNLR